MLIVFGGFAGQRQDDRCPDAGAPAEAIEVEVICSNVAEHRRRVETRTADIEGYQLPTWQDVIKLHYENWHRPNIIVDTAGIGVDQLVAALIDRLGLDEAPTI